MFVLNWLNRVPEHWWPYLQQTLGREWGSNVKRYLLPKERSRIIECPLPFIEYLQICIGKSSVTRLAQKLPL